MGHAVGIDLGTTYSCIAMLENGKPRVVANHVGRHTTPSVVSFTEKGETLIGNLAARHAILNPENTIYAVKRLMGKKFHETDVQKTKEVISYKLGEASNGDVLIYLGSKQVAPQEISSIILGYLKGCMESYLGDEVTEAVITVPAHFNDHQRQATKDAANIAGIEIIRVINEPTAASLAYGLDTKKNGVVAVYDMGGGTFDITFLEINNGIFQVLSTNGNTYLGGVDFDNRIVDWILTEYKREHNIDISENRLALQRIKEASEKAKCELSFTKETEINLPFIYTDQAGPRHVKIKLTRQRLEEMTQDLIQGSIPFIEKALQESGIKVENIDDVLLIGGQTRMPLIRETISKFFGKEPIQGVSPDESVAMGASIQAGILNGVTKDLVLLLDVTPLSLGIETEKETFTRIIEKNTTIPTRKTMSFTTVEDNQSRVKIHVLQGESDKASENVSLGMFNLIGIARAPAGVPDIDVTFEINADGLVRVSAKDTATGREQGIEVRPASGLTEKEIQNIIDSQKQFVN